MSLGFGFNKSNQSSSSSSESGVARKDRGLAAGEAFRVLAETEPLIKAFYGNVPQLNLTNGLTPGASNLAGTLVDAKARDFFSKLSAGGAADGQVHPQNTSNVIGSATQRAVESVLPQFIQQAQANELFNTTSQQNTQAQALSFLGNLAQLFQGLTQGSSARSQGSASSFGMNTSGGIGDKTGAAIVTR